MIIFRGLKNLFFLLSFFTLVSTYAGVSLKNGNFYVTYKDVTAPGGGHTLEITRTYNSKATKVGWFGFGWGSDFETYLSVPADGSVIIHENGTGARTRFIPKEAVNADGAVEKILAAMTKKSTLSAKSLNELKTKLRTDAFLRQSYAKKYNVSAKLPSGLELYSNDRGIQKLKVVNDGFVRIYNDGKKEKYSKDGKLEEIKDQYGYKINFEYKSGTLHAIKDSQAKQIFFDWYSDGRVKSISSVGKKKANYFYENNNLVKSTDVNDNSYSYEYDSNHNMTGIVYSDKTKLKISYNKTQFVSQITERNGFTTKYDYGENPQNPQNHYWTSVTKKGLDGKPTKNRYEYEVKSRPDGSKYTYKILTEIHGIKTETIYSECCSLPLKITRGKDVTNFDYNSKGLLVKKTSTRGEYIELSYDDRFNKVSKVIDKKGWTKFEYDKSGNLFKAENNEGRSVGLFYNTKGQIKKMVDYDAKDKKKRTLTFEYNALGKPVIIAIPTIGKINVSYDDFGEIKKVDSKAGHKMALQVTQAFQSLLSIVKPAGVNFKL